MSKLIGHNEEFIEHELKEYKGFFDNIDGQSLDKQQRSTELINFELQIIYSNYYKTKNSDFICIFV